MSWCEYLTHWSHVTRICISKLTIICSDHGLSPGRCQVIIWTNAGILLIGTLGIDFNDILIEIHTFSFRKTHLKMSSGKWRPFCLCLNVLRENPAVYWAEPWLPYGVFTEASKAYWQGGAVCCQRGSYLTLMASCIMYWASQGYFS